MSYLADVNGLPTSLCGSPCIGRCSTTWGDIRCKGCGRTEVEIRDWNTYSPVEKKLINLKNSKNYNIRQKFNNSFDKLVNINMQKEEKIKEIENKLFSVRCLIEMVGAEFRHTFANNEEAKESYEKVCESLESIKEAKKLSPVENK